MPRGYEFYPGRSEQLEEPVYLRHSDEDLIAAVTDTEGSEALFNTSPITWLRCAIAAGSGRRPSDINDKKLFNELSARSIDGSLCDWDPRLTGPVTDHLQEQGYFIFN